jgi:hypothetical protein
MAHIAGELNVWADMLSRWMNPHFGDANRSVHVDFDQKEIDEAEMQHHDVFHVGITPSKESKGKKRKTARSTSKAAIANQSLQLNFAHGNPRVEIPSNEVIKFYQLDENLEAEDLEWKRNNSEKLILDEATGLLRYMDRGWWLPKSNVELLVRMCIGAHCSEAGHRSTAVTVDYLKKYVWWEDMEAFVQTFNDTCLVCLKHKNSSHTVPRPLGQQLKATNRGEILCMDYMYIGGKAKKHNYSYILVLKDKFSNFVELIPCEAPNSVNAAEAISWWISRFTKPRYFMSDRGTHFTSKLMHELAKYFNIEHHFTTAYCPWSNGSVERANRDLKGLLKVILTQVGCSVDDWPYVLPAVMNVMNSTSSATLGDYAPKEIFIGMPRYDPFQYIITPHGTEDIESRIDKINLNAEDIKKLFAQVITDFEAMHNEITPKVLQARDRVAAANEKQRCTEALRKARAKELGIRLSEVTYEMCIPKFMVGDYVLVAIPKQPKNHKLQATWRGPYRIIRTISDYVYEVEHVVTKDITEHHVSRLQYYADSHLDMDIPLLHESLTRELSFDHSFDIHSVVRHAYNRDLDQYQLLIRWSGFSELENTWESLDALMLQVPRLVKEYVLGLPDSDSHKATLLGMMK